MDLNELYQELIIDHGTNPRNHCCPKNFTNDAKGINPLCGDKVHVYLTLENEIITNISFEGTGCAISIASASLMSEILKGKTLNQAKNIFTHFKKLLSINIENQNILDNHSYNHIDYKIDNETENELRNNNNINNKIENELKNDNIMENKDIDQKNLGKLNALAGVKQFPNRIKCATLAWHALFNSLKNH